MLPNLRFLLAAALLSLGVLVFGFGTAALLRSSHDEFASLPMSRAGREPLLTQFSQLNPPAIQAPASIASTGNTPAVVATATPAKPAAIKTDPASVPAQAHEEPAATLAVLQVIPDEPAASRAGEGIAASAAPSGASAIPLIEPAPPIDAASLKKLSALDPAAPDAAAAKTTLNATKRKPVARIPNAKRKRAAIRRTARRPARTAQAPQATPAQQSAPLFPFGSPR